jgi:hypothetical protein
MIHRHLSKRKLSFVVAMLVIGVVSVLIGIMMVFGGFMLVQRVPLFVILFVLIIMVLAIFFLGVVARIKSKTMSFVEHFLFGIFNRNK